MADGYITIETKLYTNKFDKQVIDLEKKIKNEENKAQLRLKAKLQAEDELKRHKQAILEIEQEYEKTSQQVEHLQSIMSKQSKGISLTPQEFTDLQGSEKVIANNEKIGETLDKMYAKEVKLNNAVDRTTLAYKQTKDNVASYKAKIESVNLQKQQAQVSQLKKGFQKVNTSVSSSIKHIGRLALGIISVASAYRLMSSASSTLGQYDEQYATNLEYIRYLIAQAIAPALKYVVNLASTLLSYLNYILNAWFGITLFSKNSAKNFMSAKNSTGGISKNTGKIKKDLQTTAFDEMNILSDTSSDSAGGASSGGGAIAPSIDPSMLQGEVPDWLKWIADNKDLVIMALVGIAGGIALITKNSKALLELGIFMIIKGIVDTVKAIVEFIKDPSWENFGEILEGLSGILFGVALAMLAVNAANPTAWIILLIALVVLLVAEIIKHWDEIKETLGKVGDWINENVIQPVAEFFKGLWDKIKEIFAPVIDFFKNIWDTVKENIKISIDNMKQIFSFLWDKIKEIFSPVIDWFREKFQKAYEKIKEVFSPIANFFGEIWDKVKNKLRDFGAKVGEVVGGAFKAVVNGVINALERILNNPINAINNLIDVINNVPGLHLTRLRTFNLPRLAKGTILNAPGRGVPVAGGTALAGEAGREAYLPLSDTQLLEELGSTIGKYITINANITNTMNGRIISRQLQKIQNDSNFAYNS